MLACSRCVQVLRPWCHFELPDSDYLPAGRRNPELPGPSGVVEPLDPATKVDACTGMLASAASQQVADQCAVLYLSVTM
jgi:hypothetical protein